MNRRGDDEVTWMVEYARAAIVDKDAEIERLKQEILHYEAQDGLLEKAQQEARQLRGELESALNPLDAEMARLNATLIQANDKAFYFALRAEAAEARVAELEVILRAARRDISLYVGDTRPAALLSRIDAALSEKP